MNKLDPLGYSIISLLCTFFLTFYFIRKKIKIIFNLCERDYLYPSIYFGIKKTSNFILGDHKYLQELKFQFFSDVTCHMRLIHPPQRCQLRLATKELDLYWRQSCHKISKYCY